MEKLTKGWVYHLRKTARQETAGRGSCPLCDAEIPPDIESFKAHVRADAARHAGLAHDVEIEQAFQNVTIHNPESASPPVRLLSSRADVGLCMDDRSLQPGAGRPAEPTGPARPHRKRPTSGPLDNADRPDARDRWAGARDHAGPGQRGPKKMCSPPASVAHQPDSSPPTPGRSRARPSGDLSDFDRGHTPKNPGGRQLWNPDQAPPSPGPLARVWEPAALGQLSYAPVVLNHRPPHGYRSPRSVSSDSAPSAEMIWQPETQPIPHDQLVAEVKGIYAGLVMIESKCIEYDGSQQTRRLSHEQYSALITLHRSLLHEHHDFFLASQHPSASDGLRRLACKYAMPARMWRHGIHSFLELLRHKLPGSLEHMLTFIYIAYSMMALLYETVPAFEDTWIECLGDLGRYRMAIEDDDIRDRETWTGVSRYWYSMASDKSPATGRLYHHPAILSRPNALQQLYYYAKSLCVPIPFPSARESVMTLFDPLLSSAAHQRLEPVDAAFVRVHGILFSGKAKERLEPAMDEFCSLLDGRIGSARSNWLEAGQVHPPTAMRRGVA